MPRRMKTPRHPKPIVREANNPLNDDLVVKANEVEWPRSRDVSTSFAGMVHVIQDRLHPRHFSTLGHKVLVECPQCGALCGDQRGFMNHRHYHDVIAAFMQMVLKELEFPAQEDEESEIG
jgi:hypothetical protein